MSRAAIFRDGLWWNNPGLVQLLGLCPLLAVSRTFVTGLGLGLATLFVLSGTSVLVSLARRWVDPRVRLPAFVLIIAAFVTAVDVAARAWWFDLYLKVGLFVPLIVTNCVILARAEAFASHRPPVDALVDGFAHGSGFLAVLVSLGTIRELVGYGSLFRGAEQLFGPGARNLVLSFTEGGGLLIATLPPGAFFALACLVALRNLWLRRPRHRATPAAPAPAVE